MTDVPAWFWMIVIAGLSGMLGVIMYYMAMLLRELTLTVREARYVVVEFHDILDSAKIMLEKANRAVDTVASTLETISSTIIKPVIAIGTALTAVRSFVTRFTGEVEE